MTANHHMAPKVSWFPITLPTFHQLVHPQWEWTLHGWGAGLMLGPGSVTMANVPVACDEFPYAIGVTQPECLLGGLRYGYQTP